MYSLIRWLCAALVGLSIGFSLIESTHGQGTRHPVRLDLTCDDSSFEYQLSKKLIKIIEASSQYEVTDKRDPALVMFLSVAIARKDPKENEVIGYAVAYLVENKAKGTRVFKNSFVAAKDIDKSLAGEIKKFLGE